MPKGGWKEYFVFSKKERVAVFILFAIMAVFACMSFFYTPVFDSPVIDQETQNKLSALSQASEKNVVPVDNKEDSGSAKTTVYPKYSPLKKEQFFFDPNTISIEGWKRLGFRDKTITNILHYRNEVGKFNKPEDLYNVPRIRKKAVAAIIPFVRFGAAYSSTINLPTAQKTALPANGSTVKTPYKTINVNTATPDDFKVFPGITDAVANRIVKFRTSINGFTSVEDVAKTYGLHDSTFRIMRPFLTIAPK